MSTATRYTVQRYRKRSTWLRGRRECIGASDHAGILGEGYADQTPTTVWWSKVHADEPAAERDADDLRLRVGHALQPLVLQVVERQSGWHCEPAGDFDIYSIDYLGATMDGFCDHPEHGRIPVEAKALGIHALRDWPEEGEPPLKYQIQLQHQMWVLGVEAGILAAIIGNSVFRWTVCEFSHRFMDNSIKGALRPFWFNYVLPKEPPPPDGREATSRLYRGLWTPDDELSVELSEDEELLWDELETLTAEAKSIDERKKRLEQQIQQRMQDATVAMLPSGRGFKWKAQERKGYTVQPGVSRPFRRVKKV